MRKQTYLRTKSYLRRRPQHWGSEVENLTTGLRDISRKYYQQIDMQNRFTSDMIHEVKNPLTSLRATVKALELVKDEAQRQKLLE